MAESVTLNKSKEFSIRIIKLYNFLCKEKMEYVMSKQLLRCGTSIGANLAEAMYGISRKDFLSKVSISLKECAETKYWLELLNKTGYLNESEYTSINTDCTELTKLLASTVKTTRQNDEKQRANKESTSII